MAAVLSRHLKTRRVIYKSAALERAAPQLVAAAPVEAISTAHSIRQASATAEEARLDFKEKKDIDIGSEVEGTDEEAKAKKYQRRLAMNRRSAAASRARREAYTKALEVQLFEMERQYREAERTLQEIRKRNWQLEIARVTRVGDHHTFQTVKPRITEEPIVADAVNTKCNNNEEDFNLSDVDDVSPEVESIKLPEVSFEAPQFTTEEFLTDLSFCQNMDALGGEVPDILPECFRYLPIKGTDKGDESTFL